MTPATPHISVVVATRNRPSYLEHLLESLRSQTLGPTRFEVVVVDDASGPETAQVLDRHQSRGGLALRTIRRETSRGPAAPRNDGWRAAAGAVVAFVDDDCVADRRWLEEGLRAATEHPAAIVQGRVEPIAQQLPNLTFFSHTFSNDRCGPWYETANIFYPRDLLERMGGFDAEAFVGMGGADTDLAWRAIEAGTPAVMASEARVYHAVVRVGALGRLRRASRWSNATLALARHPGLRRHLVAGVFWNRVHLDLARAAAALVVPRRLWPLRLWLAGPYLRRLVVRRSGPLLAPYIVLHDLVEVVAVVRGAIRYRTPVI
jgi:glycosyltransferase involved in cell wall biosynthesis